MNRVVSVETVVAVYAKLQNRPGALQHLSEALGAHHINMDAVSCETTGDQGMVRFLTHKPREAVQHLRHAGVEAYESELVVVGLPNKPTQLAHATRELAAAGINVEGIVTTPEGRLAFRTSDQERAAQVLRKLS